MDALGEGMRTHWKIALLYVAVGALCVGAQPWRILDLDPSERALLDPDGTVFPTLERLLHPDDVELPALLDSADRRQVAARARTFLKHLNEGRMQSRGEWPRSAVCGPRQHTWAPIDSEATGHRWLFGQSQIAMAFRQGHPAGFQFVDRPPPFFDGIGLQRLDVVERINGVPLTAPSRLVYVYWAVQGGEEVDLDVVRTTADGDEMRFSVQCQLSR